MNKSGNDRQVYVNKKINHVCYKGNLYAPWKTEDGRTHLSPSFQNLERLQEASQDSEFNFNDRVMIDPVLNDDNEWVNREFITVTSSSDSSKTAVWGLATDIIRQKRTSTSNPSAPTVIDNTDEKNTDVAKSEEVLEKIDELNNIILDMNSDMPNSAAV